MNKNLVCYFSATGTTKEVAEKIASIINADLFAIEPVNKYTSEDLDWTNKQSRSSIEMVDETSRPAIKNIVANITEYQNVVIGFPVWWYKEPAIIDTFIEENNLSNKQVYVYVKSGGSTVDGSLESLRQKYPNINFVSGKRLGMNIEEQAILDWFAN